MKCITFALAHRPWKICRNHYNAPNKIFFSLLHHSTQCLTRQLPAVLEACFLRRKGLQRVSPASLGYIVVESQFPQGTCAPQRDRPARRPYRLRNTAPSGCVFPPSTSGTASFPLLLSRAPVPTCCPEHSF